MKLSVFLLVCTIGLAQATGSYAQNATVSLKMQNQTVKEVLDEIEEQSDFSFFFNIKHVDLQRKVSVVVDKSDIFKVLETVFDGTDVRYSVIDRKIILSTEKTVNLQDNEGKRIIGVVKDQNGEPIIGANIVEKGTTNGVITDIDGKFSLMVSEKAMIQVSYIGYVAQELAVGNRSDLTIMLKEDSQSLDEVIVVGYGTQKKVNLSGSVSQVDSKMLTDRPVQNVSSALQGLMPGVTIASGQGRPGQDDATIRIRGVGTLNTADPYILVDGIETGTMNSVDPNDIESISVLKDAASAAIYGSKASNGVILITTKRGKEGKARVSYSGNVGIQNPTEKVDRLSSYDYARLLSESMKYAGIEPSFTDAEIQKFKEGTDPNYPNTDWYDLAYRTGVVHTHNVNVNGGTENVKYMGSLGYLHQSGILPNANRQQFNVRTNLDMKLTSRLSARLNMAYINNDYSDPTSSFSGGGSREIIRQVNRIAPWIVSKYDDGTYGTISDGNPIAWLDLKQTAAWENSNFSGIASLDYDIIDGLKATMTGSYVSNQQHYHEFQKYIRYNVNKESKPNRLNESNSRWERTVFDAMLNYDKQFGKHSLKLLAGWHAEKYDYSENKAYRENFPNNDLTDMDAGEAKTQTNSGYTRELAMLAWFTRVNYDYEGKYLFEANIRSDASSRFAAGNRWGYFPSFSAAWRLSEEPFMQDTKSWLSNLKLRASWGLLGNQDALDDYYPWMITYSLSATYPFGGVLNSGYSQDKYNLSTITWEKSRTGGIGIDMLLNNNISLSFDYYDRKTTGIIMDMPVPDEFGLGPYKDNVGEMSNRGIEVMLGYNKTWSDWSLGATVNFSYNKNEILELGGVTSMVDPNNKNKRRVVGERLNSYYMYVADGFFSSDKEAEAWMNKYAGQKDYPFGTMKFKGGDLIYKDMNGDGKITSDDRTLCGSSDPSYTYALNLTAKYKGFDLAFLFTGAAGGRMLLTYEAVGHFIGDSSHPAEAWLDAWRPDNLDATMPRVSYATTSPSHCDNVVSSFWLQKTNYLRLKNLQFGYTFPKSWLKSLGIQNVRAYYSVENLFTVRNMLITVDPEIRDEAAGDYPLLQTHSFGLNLTF